MKEGWDNPNVFTICKLRSSGSEISKLKDVRRGLRLPVDSAGNRISDKAFMLNYIIDFTEKGLRRETRGEINSDAPSDQKRPLSITPDDIEVVARKLGRDPNMFLDYSMLRMKTGGTRE